MGGWEVQTIFTEDCVMYKEKHVLLKEMFANRLNMSFILLSWVKKTLHGMQIYRLSIKDSVLGTAVCKDGNVDSFL